jgi:hypothetical protein
MIRDNRFLRPGLLGLILVLALSLSAVAQVDWMQANTDGFGDVRNRTSYSMVVGSLVVRVVSPTSGVWYNRRKVLEVMLC